MEKTIIRYEHIIAGALLKFDSIDDVDISLIINDLENKGFNVYPYTYFLNSNFTRNIKRTLNGGYAFYFDELEGIDYQSSRERVSKFACEEIKEYFSKINIEEFKEQKQKFILEQRNMALQFLLGW